MHTGLWLWPVGSSTSASHSYSVLSCPLVSAFLTSSASPPPSAAPYQWVSSICANEWQPILNLANMRILGLSFGHYLGWRHLLYQRAKKVVSDSPGLVDFVIGLVNSVFNLLDGQVMFLSNSNKRRTVKSILLVKKLLGLVQMMSGLVNASFSLPEGQKWFSLHPVYILLLFTAAQFCSDYCCLWFCRRKTCGAFSMIKL